MIYLINTILKAITWFLIIIIVGWVSIIASFLLWNLNIFDLMCDMLDSVWNS